jgi:3-oxoacyl-[acyl-carrier-protein] synthase II
MNNPRRVVITGMGIVSPIGLDEETVWSNLLAGQTGIGPITLFDASENKVQIGAEIDSAVLDDRQQGRLRRADRAVRLAIEASRQALEQARRLGDDPPAEQDVAVIWGSGVGPAHSTWAGHVRLAQKGPKGLRPSSVPNLMMNTITANISIHFRLTGSNQTIVSACTSATNAIGQSFRMVRDGHADAVLCGGVDASLDPFYYGVWNNLGVFSTIPEPERALRPFDADRAGTLLGEGAGALMIETLESAERRGAAIRGEIVGYGESSDASNMTAPSAAGQAKAITRALDSAGLSPNDIDFINAHGTATQANDVTESQSIRQALGSAADAIPVSANKSYFGHTLGASGALESVVTILGLERGVLPPNLNLDNPDPECRVRLVGSEPMELAGTLAMKNSFGFGGGNGVLVFRRSA